MNKKAVVFFALLFVCLTLFYAMPSKAIVLPVNTVGQHQANWCTFAATQAIENYYGKSSSQCSDVNWRNDAWVAAGWWWSDGHADCCPYARLTAPYPVIPDTAWQCDMGNYLMYNEVGNTSPGNVSSIMTQVYGTGNAYINSSLGSATDVQTEINAGRPFLMDVGTYTLGAFHAIVGYGISGSSTGDAPMPNPASWGNTYVHVMDPDSNGGSSAVYRGNLFFDQRPSANYPYWFNTLKTTTYVAPPVATISVNGTPRSGTVYVNHNYLLNVAASLAPNGFTGTQADWWVAAQYHGVLYYYVNGNWTTAALPTWQKQLAVMNPTTIWSSYIAVGDSVTFYVGVDLARNGILDNPYHYTYVTVIGY